MWVAYVSVGGLYASAEGRPVVLIRDRLVFDVTSGIGGVCPGMRARAAELAAPGVPHLTYLPARHDRLLGAFWRTLEEAAPIVAVDPERPHTAFVAWPGSWPESELELIRRRYPAARIGVAANRLVAKAILPDRPGLRRVLPDEAASAVSRLPVKALWTLPKGVQEQLLRLGLETAGEVASIPQAVLVNRIGQAGYLAGRAARGQDDQGVRHKDPDPELAEHRLWAPPCQDRLPEAVAEMAARATRRLPGGVGARELVLTLDGRCLKRSWPTAVRDPGRIERTAALLVLGAKVAEVEEATVSLRQLAVAAPAQERLFGPDQSAIPELADVCRGVVLDRYDTFLRRYDPLFGGSDGQGA